VPEDEKAYFCRRAEEEIERAQQARDERVVSFHYRLAGLYLDKVHGAGDPLPDQLR
jgi:hypothetical protein